MLKWIADLLTSFVTTLTAIIQFVIDAIKSIFSLLQLIPQYINYLVSLIQFTPQWLIVFLVGIITIRVIWTFKKAV